MKNIPYALLATLTLLLFSCSATKKSASPSLSLKDWRSERLKSLQAPNGWLSLTGLYWFNEGVNTFGSLEHVDIRIAKNTIPYGGSFLLQNGEVKALLNQKISTSHEPNHGQLRLFKPNNAEETMQLGSHQFTIIQRGELIGIRARDTLHPNRFVLNEIPHFPENQSFKVQATVHYKDTSKTIPITNVLGQTRQAPIVGTLAFEMRGENHELYAIDGGPDKFFVIFADKTSGGQTYGGGRFMYPNKPKSGNKTWIDFNKAYNPPCVFTPYATCPLPPKENRLELSILAGEKYVELDFDH